MLTGRYSHNHGVEGNRPPSGGYGRLDKANTLPVWLQRRGLRHGPHRQVPQRLRPRRAGRRSARLDRVVRVGRPLDLPDVGLHAERERDAEDLREPRGRGSGALPDRRLPREGGGLHPAPLGPRQALLPVGRVPGPPRRGAPGPSGRAGRRVRPAPRHKGRFASKPLPRPPSFNELDVSDKPRLPPQPGAAARPSPHRHDHARLPGAPGGAAVGRRGGAADRRHAALDRASWPTPTSSSPPTTASSTASTGCPTARCWCTSPRPGCRCSSAAPASAAGAPPARWP